MSMTVTKKNIAAKQDEKDIEKKTGSLKEEHLWKVIENFFKQHGLVHQQTESFNHFINRGIQDVIDEESAIEIIPIKGQKYIIKFGAVSITPPGIIEDDRNLKIITPAEARNRDLNYDSAICCDIIETLYEEEKVVEEHKHSRVCIGRTPIMLGSDRCVLKNMTKDERIKAGECENDPGGYFIIKGNERAIVCQLRGNYNQVIVLKQKDDEKYSHIAEIRSMSEETGHSIQLKAMIGNDDRSLVFSLPYVKETIHVGVVFKALGYTSDEDIVNLIGLQSEHTKKYTRLILRDSFFIETQEEALSYIGQHSMHVIPKEKRKTYAWQVVETELFPHLGISATVKEKGLFLGHVIKKLISTKIGLRDPDDRDNYSNKRVETTGMLCTELFRTLFKRYINTIKLQIEKKKARCEILSILSRLNGITQGLKHSFSTGNWGVQKNAYIRTGVSQVLSRMTYGATLSHLRRVVIPVGKEGKNAKIRQIHSSQFGGICPAETPEGASSGIVLNFSLLAKVSKKIPTALIKEVLEKNENITPANDVELSKTQNSTHVFLNGILIGMTENPTPLIEDIKTLRRCRRIDSDISVSYDPVDDVVNVFCDAGRIIRPLFTTSNGSLNIKDTDGDNWNRLVRKNYIEYLDNSEIENNVIAMTPELIKEYIHEYCEIHPSMLLGVMGSIIPFPDHSPSPRNCYQCLDPKELVYMADGTRKPIGNIKVGEQIITVNPVTYEKSITRVINHYIKKTDKNIIKLTTESGRSIICTDDHLMLTPSGWVKAKDADRVCVINNDIFDEYNKYLCYYHFNGKLEAFCDWHRLTPRKNDAIFVKVDNRVNQPNGLICDITTESDNHSFIAGDSLCVHNCSMGKQALGIHALSYKTRTDTITHVLGYPQKPLVSTRPSKFMGFNEMPSGINAIVAILAYTGYNQEDSVIMSKGFIDRGGFSVTSYRTVSDVEKKGGMYTFETIGVPPISSVGIKQGQSGFFKRKNGNYSLLDERGIVKKGIHVKRGDLIIGKILTKSSKSGEEKKTDCSISIKQGEEGIVDSVHISTTPNGYKMVKVVIRHQRLPEIGDKVASRAAQKGTIGAIYRQEDMPFNLDGISPDIIINPHCIPSRMTTNQLMECVLGKACAIKGEYGDATPWTSSSTGNAAEKICEMLAAAGMQEQKGYDRTGWETLTNGFTGEPIEARVFMGPTYYQRLKHMVGDKMHSRAQGHVTTLTRQPLEGRSRDGGLRFGEMERDCMISHGASRFLKERLFDCSDPYQIIVCDKCGMITSNQNECTVCKEDNVSTVNIPYAAKLLVQELQAMSIKVAINPNPVKSLR